MSDKLGWRMVGAVWLLCATTCQTRGLTKYEDATFGRIFYAIVCTAFFYYLTYRAWRKELCADTPEREARHSPETP